jgi:hypothetical protein
MIFKNLMAYLLLTTLISCGGAVDHTGEASATQPTISVTAATTDELTGAPVTFEVVANDYTSIQCDFDGDGSFDQTVTTTAGDFVHTYNSAGSYYAFCRAINNDGYFVNSNSLQINISPSPVVQPTIAISTNTTNVRPGEEIIFEVVSSDYETIQCDYDGDELFDITTTSADSLFAHNYDLAGIYYASCRTVNSEGYSVNSNSLEINISYVPGDIIGTFPYPDGIKTIADVYYNQETNTLFALAFHSPADSPAAILEINYDTGAVITEIPLVDPPFSLNYSSEMVRAGQDYYTTSYGWSNGVAQSHIYKIDATGIVVETLACPAAKWDGFCEGLAWDGQFLWSGASDSRDLTRFILAGEVDRTLSNVSDTNGIKDISYDAGKDRLVAIKYDINQAVDMVDPADGTMATKTLAGSINKGDWATPYWISINSSNLTIEKVYVGE